MARYARESDRDPYSASMTVHKEVVLNIDIISDVVYAWCHIGKRQIEAVFWLYAQQNPGAQGSEALLDATRQAETAVA